MEFFILIKWIVGNVNIDFLCKNEKKLPVIHLLGKPLYLTHFLDPDMTGEQMTLPYIKNISWYALYSYIQLDFCRFSIVGKITSLFTVGWYKTRTFLVKTKMEYHVSKAYLWIWTPLKADVELVIIITLWMVRDLSYKGYLVHSKDSLGAWIIYPNCECYNFGIKPWHFQKKILVKTYWG